VHSRWRVTTPWLTGLLRFVIFFSHIKNSRGFNTPRYEVDLTLTEHPPEWMPMYGKKIHIFYPGMKTQCNACYGIGHMKRDCKEQRTGWMGYVARMKASGKFEDRMFGSWLEDRQPTQGQQPNTNATNRGDQAQQNQGGQNSGEVDLRVLLNNPGSLRRALSDLLTNPRGKGRGRGNNYNKRGRGNNNNHNQGNRRHDNRRG
jgi:hypothetical protein